MIEYPLISKKSIRTNKTLKSIQKASCKIYRRPKGRFPKAKIGKVVKLRDRDCFYDLTEYKPDNLKLIPAEREDILNQIESMEICGLSGSGFPTFQKLKAVMEAKAKDKYLIVNGVECDPGLLHDKWLLKNHCGEIEKGIELLAKCINFKKIILATKEEPTSINPFYEVKTVPNRYPLGAESILINEVLDIELAYDELPSVKGILVLNIQTVYTIYEAIYNNRPANSRFVTIANLSNGNAIVVRVKLNSIVKDIVSKINKVAHNQPIYLGGGIMAGRKANDEDKITAKINFIGYGKEVPPFENLKCKKCGACARKCPMDIKVNKIIKQLEQGDLSNRKEFHPERCIQCGTCTYYCHAGKNTMELVTSLKEKL